MNDPAELELGWTRHQDMVVGLAPLDRKHASWKLRLHLAAGSAGPSSADGSSAGRRPASRSDARAALPHAQFDRAFVYDFGERDIGAFRKKRMALQPFAECFQIKAIGIADPENTVWIAHISNARLGQHAAVGQGEGQANRASIGGGLRQRYVIPGEAGRAHVDRYTAVFANARIQLVPRPRQKDSCEVYVGEEFVGVVYEDEDEEGSFMFEMAILSEDLVG